MTYAFGFFVNAIIATVIAGICALIVTTIVRRKRSASGVEEDENRANWGLISFVVIWLALMVYGCVNMFRAHYYELSKREAVDVIPGLLQSDAQVVRAEQIAEGDTAQTYLLVTTTAPDVERIANRDHLKPQPYDAATTFRDSPNWWPRSNCRNGVTYRVDPFDDPKAFAEYVLNWCPTEQRAYIEHFDY